MNNTITLPQVITQLAKLTNTDSNTARLFLRAFFATIEKNLVAGETVVIKNIGNFKRSDDPTFGSSEGVVFVPDKAITDKINAPFAMFNAVELAAGLSDTDLAEAEPKHEPEPDVSEPQPVAPPVAPAPAELNPEVAPQPEPEHEPEPEKPAAASATESLAEITEAPVAVSPTPEPEPVVRPAAAPVVPPPAVPEDEEPEDTAPQQPHKKSRVWLWALIIIVLAIVGGYFAAVYAVPDFEWDDENEMPEEDIVAPVEPLPEIDVNEASIVAYNQPDRSVSSGPETTTPEPVVADETTAPSQAPTQGEPRYDTVTSKRFLSTMAREYYGQNIFWVYIYEANKDHLGDPNKVGAGTRVLIPEKASLPQASSQKEAIRMAEKKAAEIEARFGR